MMLDDRGVHALGKVSEERKLAELAARRRAVRALAARRELRHGPDRGVRRRHARRRLRHPRLPRRRCATGVDGLLVPPGDALALAEALRRLALDAPLRARMARCRARARRALRLAARRRRGARLLRAGAARRRARRRAGGRLGRAAVRHGLAPADLLPRIPAERLPSLHDAPAARRSVGRPRRLRTPAPRRPRSPARSRGAGLAALALQRVGVDRVAASPARLQARPASPPASALMCAAMFARAIAWHAILAAAPTWRRAKRRDAMQGTFIGVLMSATLPARLGEPSRALIVARRLGRARETLPVVLGTMVSQTLLNLLALGLLGGVMLSSVERARRPPRRADRSPRSRRSRRCSRSLLAPVARPARRALALAAPAGAAAAGCAARCCACATGLRVFRQPRRAAARHRRCSSAPGRCSG